jgi:site-specific DNA recombinase
MEGKIRAAIYARVSTDRQEQEQTILSQLAALRAYAEGKGYEVVKEYVDDGHSGALLQRPGLDALRDALPTGLFSVVLFHSPDRLARKAVYQGLVLEELDRTGVRPEFLNYPVDDSPESKMLLGMQGLFSEYERAKTAERTRRGKQHWARQGALVGHYVPYGYRFIPRSEGKRAHLESDENQAAVVAEMFRLLVEDHKSIRAVAVLLTERAVPTAKGARQWQPMVVDRMIRNPTYRGDFIYHKTVYGTANDPANPRAGQRPRPPEEWVHIPVPALVDDATWYAAQRQLEENSRLSSRNNTRHQYLLRGLIRCPRCGATYTGMPTKKHRIYRCSRTDSALSSTGQKCSPGSIKAAPVEQAVWDAITDALQKPDMLADQYRRQLGEAGAADGVEAEQGRLQRLAKQLRQREDRLLDLYLDGGLEKPAYEGKARDLRREREGLTHHMAELDRRAHQDREARNALEGLETFCKSVVGGLEAMTFEERQQLLRLLIEKVTVEEGRVRIETIIPTDKLPVKLRNGVPERSEEPQRIFGNASVYRVIFKGRQVPKLRCFVGQAKSTTKDFNRLLSMTMFCSAVVDLRYAVARPSDSLRGLPTEKLSARPPRLERIPRPVRRCHHWQRRRIPVDRRPSAQGRPEA